MLSDNGKIFFARRKTSLLLALIFAILGILLVTIGFLKTIFVMVMAVAGFFAGYLFDDKDTIRRFINNYLGK